ncbi:hypothetical protein [uncultured Kocuria sp.]|uniref:hypothetical protein n=1 Tax=uncultured Kocuria sp. TaxID=259305 RepID=UPI00262923BF|nr:hypothetical protein [uncultured Kocuria sp.]
MNSQHQKAPWDRDSSSSSEIAPISTHSIVSPSKWLADDVFWKQVASNVISAGIIAVMGITVISIASTRLSGETDKTWTTVLGAAMVLLSLPFTMLAAKVAHVGKKSSIAKNLLFFVLTFAAVGFAVLGSTIMFIIAVDNIIEPIVKAELDQKWGNL